MVVSSSEEAKAYILKGLQNRRVGVTNMNIRSSRSHAVFTFYMSYEEIEGSITVARKSQFHLIDLAGSERQKLTGTGDHSLKEACYINSSLSALGNVIRALNHHDGHVPYRDSKLTYLLRDSLGGNSLTAIIATISPSIASAAESLSTLRFATDAKMIKNMAIVNEVRFGSIASLQAEVSRLQAELDSYRNLSKPYLRNEDSSMIPSLYHQLSLCNASCSELYMRMENLQRRNAVLQECYDHMKCETRLWQESMQHRQLIEESSYIKTLQDIIQMQWQYEKVTNINMSLLQRHRFLLQSYGLCDDNDVKWDMTDTIMTMSELHRELANLQSRNGREDEDREKVITQEWLDEDKKNLLMKMEDLKNRCDELYADVLDKEEEIRIMKKGRFEEYEEYEDEERKRRKIQRSKEEYEMLMKRLDCMDRVIQEQRRIMAYQERELMSRSDKHMEEEKEETNNDSILSLDAHVQRNHHFYQRLVSVNKDMLNNSMFMSVKRSVSGEFINEEKMEVLQKDIDEKDKEIEKLKFDVIDLNKKYREEKKKADDYLQQVATLNSELRVSRQNASDGMSRMMEIENQIDQLLQEREVWKEMERERDELRARNNKLQGELITSESDFIIKEKEKGSLLETLKDQQDEIEILRKENKELRMTQENSNKEKKRLQQEIKSSIDTINGLNSIVHEHSLQERKIMEQNKVLESELNSWKERDQQVQTQLQCYNAALQAMQEENEKRRSEYMQIQRDLKTKGNDTSSSRVLVINRLKDENRRIYEKLEIAKKRIVNHGLSANDLVVESEESPFYNQMKSIIKELKQLSNK